MHVNHAPEKKATRKRNNTAKDNDDSTNRNRRFIGESNQKLHTKKKKEKPSFIRFSSSLNGQRVDSVNLKQVS